MRKASKPGHSQMIKPLGISLMALAGLLDIRPKVKVAPAHQNMPTGLLSRLSPAKLLHW